jgi:hypothetical protein
MPPMPLLKQLTSISSSEIDRVLLLLFLIRKRGKIQSETTRLTKGRAPFYQFYFWVFME